MVIGVFHNNDLPSRGGGFSYKSIVYNGVLSSSHEIIFIKRRKFQKIYNLLLIKLPFLFTFFEFFDNRFKNIDLLLCFEPSDFVISNTPFIYVCWDLANFYSNAFPEIQQFKSWAYTTTVKKVAIQRAFAVVVGTNVGKKQALDLCHVDPGKVFVIPFPARKLPSYQERMPVNENQILFYPSSYWPHKNHIFLLEFVKKYKNLDTFNYHFVFCGADKGNLSYLKDYVKSNSLDPFFTFHEFISNEELARLYKSARACVFPTLIGPDNLPPLEAMLLNCPVIVSNIIGASEQFSDSALYFDPFEYDSFYNSLMKLNDITFRSQLIEKGVLLASDRSESNYIKQFNHVINFAEGYMNLCDYKNYKVKFS